MLRNHIFTTTHQVSNITTTIASLFYTCYNKFYGYTSNFTTSTGIHIFYNNSTKIKYEKAFFCSGIVIYTWGKKLQQGSFFILNFYF